MQYPLCRHIKVAGTQCGSPALTSGIFCYFHQRQVDNHKQFRRNDPSAFLRLYGEHVELAPLEDHASIQLALSLVVNAIGTGQLDVRRATAILYGLQLATMNLRRNQVPSPEPHQVVRAFTETPDRLDLAEPGALTPDFDPQPDPTANPARQPSPASATIEGLIASPRENPPPCA